MAGVKGNRRTLYTKKIIRESLISLLQTHEIHQVTVTDICKQADINRGTFYAHYKDAFDLLQSIEDELFAQITQYILETPASAYNNVLLIKVLELIVENSDLCKILLCKQKDNHLLDRILDLASMAELNQNVQKSTSNTSTRLAQAPVNYFIRYCVAGYMAIIQAWLEADFPESPEEIVAIIRHLYTVDTNEAL
ncbi:MAG: TetR/AcrR family transcriptional regulator [Cellulosilyticaceae bacterium]